MNDCIKQHVFSSDNISLFYLCPYCKVYEIDDGFYFFNEETMENPLFMHSAAGKEKTSELISKLECGISRDKLISFLQKELGEESGEEWLAYCIQGGVIE